MKKWNPFQPWLSPFSGCETLPIKEFYHSTQKERQQPVWPDWAILKVLGYNFFQKIAQMFFNYLGSFEKHHVLSKIIFGYILGNFWNILGCFYFSIWSHCWLIKICARFSFLPSFAPIKRWFKMKIFLSWSVFKKYFSSLNPFSSIFGLLYKRAK